MGTNEFIGMLLIALGSILSVAVILVTPLLKTVKALTELKDAVQSLTEQFAKFEVNNHDDHKRIWVKSEEQDATLYNHETRLTLLENEQELERK